MNIFFTLISFAIVLMGCTHTEIKDNRPVQSKPTNVLTLEKISEAMNEKKNEYQSCTVKTLKKQNKKLARGSSLLIHIVIAGDGHVQSIAKESANFNNAAVEKCYLDSIRSIQFLNTINGNEVDISYPFSFDYLEGK